MNELEETEVERQFLLGDAPMRTSPTTQERPKALHRVDMHFTKAVAIFIAGVLAPAMVDALMPIAPRLKTGINAVRIWVYQGACLHGVFHEGLDRLLLHIGQQMDHDLPPTLNSVRYKFCTRVLRVLRAPKQGFRTGGSPVLGAFWGSPRAHFLVSTLVERPHCLLPPPQKAWEFLLETVRSFQARFVPDSIG